MHTILVVHGAGEPRRRNGKVYWEPLLAGDLGAGWTVTAPRMPDPDKPTYKSWAARIATLVGEQANPVLVGHSFGASVLLKFLAESKDRPAIAGLFLVATPYWGPEFPEFTLPPDFGARLSDVSPLFLYHSKDDPEIPFEHLERYARALPHATVRALDGRGHEFDQPHFPELVADIRRLVAPSSSA